MASVVMVSSQRPSRPIIVMVMTVKMASPLPENFQAATGQQRDNDGWPKRIQTGIEAVQGLFHRPFEGLEKIAVVIDQPVDKLGYPHIEWNHFIFKHGVSPCSGIARAI